jgi:hypothetical protein
VIEFQPEAGATTYRVTGKVTNAASGAASNLRAQLTTDGCTLPGNDKEKELGNVLAKRAELKVSWRVQPKVDTLCKLRLEVVGAYAIPDLQYARVERLLMPQHVAQEVSKPKPPEPPSQPSQPTNVEDSGATFFLPTCHDPEKEKCKSIEVKGPGIPPGATVHGRWSCGRLWSGSNQLACSCLPDSVTWGPVDCGPRFNGPSFNPPACKYDGLPCGY